ncbi:transposase domain-containing protein [Kitasatospora sp. NPDC002227]|uniref:transposase domain-containing protein n=1 Tax=Kitasatospora sp. NPDC002227 TaxID=3154773 RepID=UPI003326DD68
MSESVANDGVPLLLHAYPPSLVDSAVAACGRTEKRRRLLSARTMVYFVLAMDLFAPAPYQEVMDRLTVGLREAGLWGEGPLPSRASIFQARERLGPEPLFELQRSVARPIAHPGTPGTHWGGLRLLHLEQQFVDLPDRACPASRLRTVAVVETGTRTVLDAAVGEQDPDAGLLRSHSPGTLLTVCGQPLRLDHWDAAAEARTALLWQLPLGQRPRPTPERLLPDGSFLTRLAGRPVRVLAPGVFTNLLDAGRAPGADLLGILARTDAGRGALREALLGPGREKGPLTSRTSDGARQEVCGRLLVHYALRRSGRTWAAHRPRVVREHHGQSRLNQTALSLVGR